MFLVFHAKDLSISASATTLDKTASRSNQNTPDVIYHVILLAEPTNSSSTDPTEQNITDTIVTDRSVFYLRVSGPVVQTHEMKNVPQDKRRQSHGS